MPIPIPIIFGVLLDNTVKEYYRVPSGNPKLQQVIAMSMGFHNDDTVDRKVTVYIVGPGGTPGITNTKFKTMIVPPASDGNIPPNIEMYEVMLPGYSIHAFADIGSKVVFRCNAQSYP